MNDKSLSPSASIKIKSKNAAHRIKHGSPKLQEVLRQKCRERMREKRCQLFRQRRIGLSEEDKITPEVQETLSEIVREQFDSLSAMDGIELDHTMKQIINEPLDPDEALEIEQEMEEQWILEEYLRFVQEEEEREMLSVLTNDIFCPMCQKAYLCAHFDFLTCNNCHLRLRYLNGLESFKYSFINVVRGHSTFCPETPSFHTIQEDNNTSLFLTCDGCKTLNII